MFKLKCTLEDIIGHSVVILLLFKYCTICCACDGGSKEEVDTEHEYGYYAHLITMYIVYVMAELCTLSMHPWSLVFMGPLVLFPVIIHTIEQLVMCTSIFWTDWMLLVTYIMCCLFIVLCKRRLYLANLMHIVLLAPVLVVPTLSPTHNLGYFFMQCMYFWFHPGTGKIAKHVMLSTEFFTQIKSMYTEYLTYISGLISHMFRYTFIDEIEIETLVLVIFIVASLPCLSLIIIYRCRLKKKQC